MPLLRDPRHEKIVQTYVKGSGQVDAYVTGGFKRNHGNACKFFARPEVKQRVQELREKKQNIEMTREIEVSRDVAHKLGITKEKIIQALWFNGQRCLRGNPVLDENGVQTGKFSGKPDAAGANRAFQLIGMECYGMFVERHEIGNPGDFGRLTDEELAARMEADAAALGLSAEATEALMLTFQGNGTGNEETEK